MGAYAYTGDVVYANFFGQPIYVINSREKAEELLSKRGNVYSGRPQQILPRYMYVRGFTRQPKFDCNLTLSVQVGVGRLECRTRSAWESTHRTKRTFNEGLEHFRDPILRCHDRADCPRAGPQACGGPNARTTRHN